jgi:integrase
VHAAEERAVVDPAPGQQAAEGRRKRKLTAANAPLVVTNRLLRPTLEYQVRGHLIVRIFCVCGLRPGELFALRIDDVEPTLLRIDQALQETEKGANRIGATNTESSNAYVSTSADLYKQIMTWMSIRNMADPYHENRVPVKNQEPFRFGGVFGRVARQPTKIDVDLEGFMVRPSGFEPPTFCSGGSPLSLSP